ncbi:MAG: hypothetical protein P9M03_05330 [Candidatus Theseobacter exili]|nr:hypothetical protein [Candidatus Theseobacter exili]
MDMMQVGLFGKILLIFPVFVFIPGFIAQRTLMADESDLDFFEKLFIRILLSILITTVSGLILGFAGFYSLQNLIVQNIVISFLCMVVSRFRFKAVKSARKIISWEYIVLSIILFCAFFFCFRPSETIFGGSMSGTLVASGGALKDSGRFFVFQNSLPDVFIKGSNDLIVPASNALKGLKGLGVLPAASLWFSIFLGLFGPASVLFVSPVFAIAGVFFFFILGKWLFVNKKVGLVAAGLLSVNLAQFWFARVPSAAPLTQCMILGGCAAFARGSYYSRPKWIWVAVLSFAGAVFVQTNAIPIAVSFAVAVAVFQNKSKKVNWIQLGLIIVSVLVVMYFVLPDSIYPYQFAFYAIILPAVLALWVSFKRIRNTHFLLGLLFLTIIMGFWIRPESSQVAALVPLHWVVTGIGVFLAFVGLVWWLADSDEKGFHWIIGTSVVSSILFAVIFGFRNFPARLEGFVPFAVPAIILFISFALCKWAEKKSDYLSWILVLMLAILIGGFPLWKNRNILFYKDYQGIMSFCDDLSNEFASWETVVFDRKELAVPLRFLFGEKALYISQKGWLSADESIKVLQRWGREGWAIYFVSTSSSSFNKEACLESVAINSFNTNILCENSGEIPEVSKKMKITARIYKVQS